VAYTMLIVATIADACLDPLLDHVYRKIRLRSHQQQIPRIQSIVRATGEVTEAGGTVARLPTAPAYLSRTAAKRPGASFV
jgi:hypothetical protein